MKTTAMIAVLVAACMMTVVGCSNSKKQKTEGVLVTVTLDGTAVEGASVTFSPLESGKGTAAFGTTDKKGQARIQTLGGNVDAGTTPGVYQICVSKTEMVPTGEKYRDSDGTMKENAEPKSLLPEIYSNNATTPFQETVVAGSNEFTLELKSK
jgi:hypothetical protein